MGLSSKKHLEEFDLEVMFVRLQDCSCKACNFILEFIRPLLLIVADHAPPTLGTLSFFFFFFFFQIIAVNLEFCPIN